MCCHIHRPHLHRIHIHRPRIHFRHIRVRKVFAIARIKKLRRLAHLKTYTHVVKRLGHGAFRIAVAPFKWTLHGAKSLGKATLRGLHGLGHLALKGFHSLTHSIFGPLGKYLLIGVAGYAGIQLLRSRR
jgi:hypothetical protein